MTIPVTSTTHYLHLQSVVYCRLKTLNQLMPIFLSSICRSQNRLYPYSKDNKWEITNEKLEIVIPPKFDNYFWFRDDSFAAVEKNGKCGIINKTGKMIFPCRYEEVKQINEETGRGKRKGRYVLLNYNTGKLLVPASFEQITSYC